MNRQRHLLKLAIFPDEARIYNLKSPKNSFRTVLRLLYYLFQFEQHSHEPGNKCWEPFIILSVSCADTFPIQKRLTDSPPKVDGKLETGNWELICAQLWAGGLMNSAEGR